MIPYVLRLHNFMSYGELDLDLRGLHAAVLCGPNGAGKSSLLDAITYALWEKARSTPEQLIRLGASEMSVELVFGIEDRTYRVWRRRTRKAGGQSQLEFHQLADAESDSFVPLTGVTMRETQAKILGVVRMDYETFANSAFILQGKADQFTTKTPRERKALLADILGLQTYDQLAQRARDHWKAAQARADLLDRERAELRVPLERRSAIESAREASLETLAELGRRAERLRARGEALIRERQALAHAAERREALARLSASAESELARVQAERDEQHAALAAGAALRGSRAAIEAAYADWEALQAEEAGMRKQADAFHALALQRERLARDREAVAHAHELARRGLESELAALTQAGEGSAELLRDRPRIERAYRALVEARAAEAAQMEKGLRARELERQLAAIDAEREQLGRVALAERASWQARRAQWASEIAGSEGVRAELAAAQAEVARLDVLSVERERVKEKGFRYKARHDQAIEAARAARAAARAQEAKQTALGVPVTAPASPPLEPARHAEVDCPLCAAPLAPVGVARVLSHYEAAMRGYEDEAVHHEHLASEAERELFASRARYKALGRELARREATIHLTGELTERLSALERAERAIADLDAALAQPLPEAPSPERASEAARYRAELAALAFDPEALPVLQARLADYRWSEARHWQLEQAEAAAARLEARRPAITTALAAAQAAAEQAEANFEQQAAELDAAIAALGYDASAHAALTSRLEPLAGAPRAWQTLQLELARLEALERATAALEVEAQRHAAALETARQEQATLADAREQLARVDAAIAENQADREQLREDEGLRHAALGRIEGELARLAEAAEALTAKEAGWNEAVAEAHTHQLLAEAFGKNGIQALMIENAIPEIEEEANRLLSRMSDNRMHVRLATQKEKKAGGLAETLEIVIADEVGTRHYELYSGGEAFRVNFALRLALSKLLARRAGARLQTLVIDEGFGTQDEAGRERLIEAIHAVSSDFELILVITHIRELKEAFSTQIEVVKRGGVSTVSLVA